jgi:DNA-binding transcriptional LysR family regulator
MDLKDLRSFVVVAEELHFRRAAERLFVSQPPLSQRIRALERELGAVLFVRTTRRVELTEAGRVFLDHARAALDVVASAGRAAKLAQAGEIGRVELGYLHSTSYTLLPAILKACRTRLPGIEIRLHELAVDRQLVALLDGRVDLALARLPINHPRVDTATLIEEPMVLALPLGHPLTLLERVPLRRLVNDRIIGYPPGGEGTLHEIVAGMFARARLRPRYQHVAGTLHTALGLVRAGEGVAIVPRSLQVVQLQGVEYRPISGRGGRARVGFAWRTDRRSPAVTTVIDVATRAARIAGAEGTPRRVRSPARRSAAAVR